MATKKALATASKSLRNKQDARLDAVHTALTKYFLGSAATTEKFWKTNNPSLGDKSPANMVKAGKLSAVEQYVTYLRNHARSARPNLIDKPTDDRFLVLEGTKEEVLEKMKEIRRLTSTNSVASKRGIPDSSIKNGIRSPDSQRTILTR